MKSKIIFLILLAFSLSTGFLSNSYASVEKTGVLKTKNKVDHSKFEILHQNFKSGEELTNACLSCHNKTDEEFRNSMHWKWHDRQNGRDYGKMADTINNFCISTNKGNDKSCLDCHAGWGRETKSVNCLVCHNQTDFNFEETFADIGSLLEMDDEDSKEMISEMQTELKKSATRISSPSRKNCGSCHFYGGGGDGVKHGDLDSSLVNPDKALDVHMSPEGGDFSCTRCHTTSHHNVSGRIYTKPAVEKHETLVQNDMASKISCISCHSSSPHKDAKINHHTESIACQTCHIPTFARKNPTKMEWDWSKAGKMKDGKPFKTEDEFGKHDYMSIKGKFRWDKNVVPEYFWYDGVINSITWRDKIDPSEVTSLSWPKGSADSRKSKIYPFKIHRSVQPYDKVNNQLLTPLLSGGKGYWDTFDWKDALAKGAKFSGHNFSGEFGFAKTTYAMPITHMVTTADKALSCTECHTRHDGRLEKIQGIYIPGRDYFKALNRYGLIFLGIAFAAILFHGFLRFVSGKKFKKEVIYSDEKLHLFTRYERIWHWFQMALIFTLAMTGFEVNGMYNLFGYEDAVFIHNTAAFTWLFSFIFFIFWIFTTGEWRQYKPTTRKFISVVFFYSVGIFFGMEHPFHKKKEEKHNPVQRLTYLFLISIVLPVQIITGVLYYFRFAWDGLGLSFLNLQSIAFVHILFAFIILGFMLVHVYMTTTGHGIFDHVKSMIFGFEKEAKIKKDQV